MEKATCIKFIRKIREMERWNVKLSEATGGDVEIPCFIEIFLDLIGLPEENSLINSDDPNYFCRDGYWDILLDENNSITDIYQELKPTIKYFEGKK